MKLLALLVGDLCTHFQPAVKASAPNCGAKSDHESIASLRDSHFFGMFFPLSANWSFWLCGAFPVALICPCPGTAGLCECPVMSWGFVSAVAWIRFIIFISDNSDSGFQSEVDKDWGFSSALRILHEAGDLSFQQNRTGRGSFGFL